METWGPEDWQTLLVVSQLVVRRFEGLPLEPVVAPEGKRRGRTSTYTLTEEDLRLANKYVGIWWSKFHLDWVSKEDAFQDVVEKLLRTDYLGRHDPTRNTKSGYISIFVKNHFCQLWGKRNNAIQRAILVAEPIVESTPDEPLPDPVEDAELRQKLNYLAGVLDSESVASSGVRYDMTGKSLGAVFFGEEPRPGEYLIWRSRGTIFRLSTFGFLPKEISWILEAPRWWVLYQVRRFRLVPEIRNARLAWLAELGG